MSRCFLDDSSLELALPQATYSALWALWRHCDEAEAREAVPCQQLAAVRQALVKWALLRSLVPLYARASFSHSGDLFVASSIWTDGLGDYFALLRAAGALQRRHSGIKVHVIFHHKQQLPSVDVAQFHLRPEQIHPFYEGENPLTHVLKPIIEGKETLPFEERYRQLVSERASDIASQFARESKGLQHSSALDSCIQDASAEIAALTPYFAIQEQARVLRKKMEGALAIVHIALALDTFSDSILKPKSLYFAESGNFQGMENSFALNWYSMGLNPFEEGLFLPISKHGKGEWNSPLLSRLWEQKSLSTGSFHLGYFNQQQADAARLFLYLTCCRVHPGEPSSLVLLMPIAALEALALDIPWLASQQIKQIIHQKSDGTEKRYAIASQGRDLFLINCFPVTSQDFIRLIKESGPVVGCTGDGSLGECLAAGKLVFYEVRRHKMQTYQGLLELARFYGTKSPLLLQYLQAVAQIDQSRSPEERALFLAQLLEEPLLFDAWREVTKAISLYFDFEEALLGRVARHLLLSQDSSLRQKEEKAIQEYICGSSSRAAVASSLERSLGL